MSHCYTGLLLLVKAFQSLRLRIMATNTITEGHGDTTQWEDFERPCYCCIFDGVLQVDLSVGQAARDSLGMN